MKQFVSPHVHVKSLDSASTPKKFAEREVELGTGYITVTDHGTLEATRAVYDLCAKGGKYNGKLTPILGLEAYFRDDNDPYLLKRGIERKADPDGKLTYRDYYKYSHITLHAADEAAYFALVKKLSDADLVAERHGSERKPLFNWQTLEELGQHNITATSGCLIGMVGRHLLQNNDAQTAVAFYERLRGIWRPGNFYVEIFPHETDQKWQSAVTVTLEDGTTHTYGAKRKFRTASSHKDGETYAEDLAADFKKDPKNARAVHVSILDVMENRKWSGKQHLNLVSVVYNEGLVQNECKPWCNHSDYQLEVNRFLATLAKKHGDKLLISDDSHFAVPEEKELQDVLLDNWRFANSHHRMSTQEAWAYFSTKYGSSEAQFESWIENSHEWAAKFKDFKFSPRNALPTSFYPKDTLKHTMELIKKHRRMDWNNPAVVDRLRAEINLLHKSGVDLLPYFMVAEEVCDLYLRKGHLTGPGRGSAAGLKLAHLLGITHIDPMKYDLSMDRFMTADRVASGKLPDIDQDLPHRDLLVDPNDPSKGWLAERFGKNVAQMSVDIQLKLKVAIKDVHRVLDGYVPEHIEKFTKSLPNPPQGIETRDYVFGYTADGTYTPGLFETNESLQDYAKKYPTHWLKVAGLLGLPKAKGRHPCGFLIANQPVDTFIPLTTIDDTRVTAFTAASVEAMGGLKMDFLTVNSIHDVERAIKLIQTRHAPELVPDGETVKYTIIDGKEVANVQVIPYKGGFVDVWDLPQEIEVYTDICQGKVETVFQLDGPAARQGLRAFPLRDDGSPPIDSIEGLSAFTALDRPGPLDAYVTDAQGNKHNMLIEYANRARGQAGVGRMAVLDELCSATHGVIVYQEQLQNIFKVIGGTTGIQANDFRQRIGKKKLVEVRQKDKPLFMPKAIEKLGAEEAERLWGMKETFGQYGFNKSHSVSYMHTAYACSWLKHHYPLEWWTAVLSNASRDDVDEKFWPYVGSLILMPDVSKSTTNFVIEGDKIRAPVWLVHGIGEKAYALLEALAPFKDIRDFVQKLDQYRIANGTKVIKKKIIKAKKPKNGFKGQQPLIEVKDQEILVESTKKAHNPLNSSIVRKLIICGVFDALFPATDESGLPMTITDRIAMFEAVAKEVTKTKVKPMATQYNLSSEIERYQYIKSVMPAYSAPLLDMFRRKAPNSFKDYSDTMVYFTDKYGDKYGVLSGKTFEWIEELETLPDNSMEIALPAYVLSQRIFKYQNQTKTAIELVLDIDGFRRKFVKWPSKKHGLPAEFKEDLEGSFVVALFQRRNPTEEFYFQSVEVIAPPVGKEVPEESPEEPINA